MISLYLCADLPDYAGLAAGLHPEAIRPLAVHVPSPGGGVSVGEGMRGDERG